MGCAQCALRLTISIIARCVCAHRKKGDAPPPNTSKSQLRCLQYLEELFPVMEGLDRIARFFPPISVYMLRGYRLEAVKRTSPTLLLANPRCQH